MELKFKIPGNPVPWARAGVYKTRFFDKQKKDKVDFAIQAQAANPMKIYFIGPTLLQVDYYVGFPEGYSIKKRKDLEGAYHSFVPDTSNLIKHVEDSLKKIVYDDDCIIAGIIAFKRWSQHPRTEIRLLSLDGKEEKHLTVIL